MADIRIKDLATTATTTASDDFMAVDGVTNGTRKLSAATPAFLTSVTTPSLTSPAATNLTLASGAGTQNIVLQPSGGGAVDVKSGGSAGSWALIGTVPVDASGSSVYSAIPFGTNTASNPNWYVGHRFSAQGNFAIWPYNGINHLANYLTIAASTGNVTLSSTTAGSSGAGALVVAGGISAGNTGSAASYFGGAVTVAGDVVASASASGATREIAVVNTATAAASDARMRIRSGVSGGTSAGDAFTQFTDGLNFNWSIGAGSTGSRTLIFAEHYSLGTNERMRLSSSGLAIASNLALKLGNAYVGTPVVGTGYIVIQDSNGTNYKVSVAAL